MNENNVVIVEKIKQLAASKGTNIARLEKAIGFGNGMIGKWAKAPKSPPYEKLLVVADYFGVTVADLTGEKKEPAASSEFSDLSPSKQQLLSLVDTLSDEQCRKLAGIIEEAKKLL